MSDTNNPKKNELLNESANSMIYHYEASQKRDSGMEERNHHVHSYYAEAKNIIDATELEGVKEQDISILADHLKNQVSNNKGDENIVTKATDQIKEEYSRINDGKVVKYPEARKLYEEIELDNAIRKSQDPHATEEEKFEAETLKLQKFLSEHDHPEEAIADISPIEQAKWEKVPEERIFLLNDGANHNHASEKLGITPDQASNAFIRKDINDFIKSEKKPNSNHLLSQQENEELEQKQAAFLKQQNLPEENSQQQGSDNVEALEIGNAKLGLPDKVNNQYLINKGVLSTKYSFKDNPEELAFRDKGNKIITGSNSKAVADSIVDVANSKGWEQIKVNGSNEFKREVWLLANLKGIDVKGFKPSEQDKELLDKRLQSVEAAPKAKDNIESKETEIKPDSKKTSESNKKDEANSKAALELKSIYAKEKDNPSATKDPRVAEMYKFEKAAVQVANVKFHQEATVGGNTEKNARMEFIEKMKDKAFDLLAKGKSLNTDKLKHKQERSQNKQFER